ncbi:hypothetical protein E4631_23600 [Hymenobacter sp. UV11]|uniref:hypothetical protein n=1 Tax=Hymenobacter sp. UV11 TaxID=1849735 RepID=UPI00105C38EE|nr:hypothetical protein [Hymenobacter sp. UV11]TDN38128.1 hypothetical protein A8B98_25340 [Hymenobacter sp. UV11]TFZ63132.1 hypothetical protein E4631_23600 [Hymenobacter sp. UV11]
MKTLVLLPSLCLLILLRPPAGYSAHHRHHYRASSCRVHDNYRLRLLPLRVLRTPAVAEQRRLVRAVSSSWQPVSPNEQ